MYTQQKSTIQKLLDENSQLILSMIDLMARGKQSECMEHQRTLHRNLLYLIQCDPTASHHANNLPSPEVFIQTSSALINGQADYRTQINSPVQSNILNQPVPNANLYSSTAINKPTVLQQRSSYPIQPNGYGQYQISPSQQNSLLQQQWQNQSRIPSHSSTYPQQT